MTKQNFPSTSATRILEKHGVSYSSHLYPYQEKGGTAVSSRELGVSEHLVIKTLIMENEKKDPLIVLMHGNMQVSTKALARTIGAKTISPCRPETAEKHSGYQVGGTSPFGTRRAMPIYVEKSILSIDKIFINGGKRGYLVSISPSELMRVLNAIPVEVGLPSST